MTGLPYIRFYGGDWRKDPGLRLCSPASRGVWIDAISLMMEAEPYGHLAIAGRAMTPEEFAVLTNTSPKVAKASFKELAEKGVSSTTPEGMIFSRRMVKDKAKLDQSREYGKGGGNPALKPPERERVNPLGAESDNPALVTLEARSQKPEAKEERRRGTRLPADFKVPAEWLEDGRKAREEHGQPPANLELEASKFVSHFLAASGQNAVKLDWHRAWIKWALSAHATAQNGRREPGTEEAPADRHAILRKLSTSLAKGIGIPDVRNHEVVWMFEQRLLTFEQARKFVSDEELDPLAVPPDMKREHVAA